MSMKGVPHERDFRLPRLHLGRKAQRTKEEKETRGNRYEALNPKEKEVFRILREYTVAQMEAIGKETTIDEAIYARKIHELYES